MSTSPEENAIDQSLRDVFRDYDLPPDAHPRVWEGVAERISSIPPAPLKGLPYHLILPFTAMLGVGVGWLLPRPAAWDAQPSARVSQVMLPAAPKPMLQFVPAPAPQPSVSETVATAMATPAAGQPAQAVRQPTRKPRATAQSVAKTTAAPPTAATASLSDSTTAVVALAPAALEAPALVAPADTAPVLALAEPAATQPVATPPASTPPQQAVSAHLAKSSKPVGTNEKMTYRKLTQRQPESRIGIRRWFTHLFQSVRHLLG